MQVKVHDCKEDYFIMKLKEKHRHITTAAMLNVRYTSEDLKQFIGVELFNQWALTCHMQLCARITPIYLLFFVVLLILDKTKLKTSESKSSGSPLYRKRQCFHIFYF